MGTFSRLLSIEWIADVGDYGSEVAVPSAADRQVELARFAEVVKKLSICLGRTDGQNMLKVQESTKRLLNAC